MRFFFSRESVRPRACNLPSQGWQIIIITFVSPSGAAAVTAGATTTHDRRRRLGFAVAASAPGASPAGDGGSASAAQPTLEASPLEPLPPTAKKGGSKVRLDALTMELYPQYSRTLVQSWILQVPIRLHICVL